MAQPDPPNPPLPHAGSGTVTTGPAVNRALSNPGDSWVWDFDDPKAKAQAVKTSPGRLGKDAWMATERRWKFRIGKGWVPKKLLGKGGFGCVGHWSYEGPDRASKSVKELAVKQSLCMKFPLGGYGLEWEAANLLQLGTAKSQHVLKMYKRLYEETGQGMNEFDVGLVHRIFLEFCPGGDAWYWLRQHLIDNTTIPEAVLWGIFHCMARACLVMHQGSEDPDNPRPGWPQQELVHFDMKMENVLLGDPATDVEHRNMSPFKFADFGLARRVLAVQNTLFLKDYSEYGTPTFYAPEQVLTRNHLCGVRPWFDRLGQCTVQGVRYGMATNIWQVGLIMHCLMSRNGAPIWERTSIDRLRCYDSVLSARLKAGGNTLGNSNDQASEYNPKMSMYSVELRTLIHECLIIHPAHRPGPAELVKRSQKAIDLLRAARGGAADTIFLPYSEPQLSAQWYSGQRNANHRTPAQIAAAEKLHQDNIDAEKPKLAQENSPAKVSDEAILPSPPTNPPVVPGPSHAAQPSTSSGPSLRIEMSGLNVLDPANPVVAPPTAPAPAPAPVVPRPPPILYNVTQVTCIVQTQTFWGNPVTKNYTIRGITPHTLVLSAKEMLATLGCGIAYEKQVWMMGRTLMSDFMKLGEFDRLADGKGTVRVTQK